jgi:hypothetical protein
VKSVQRGTPTSGAEITNVSPSGFWMLVDGRELFLAFADFPWFEHATIREIARVERPSAHHLYWPALDVDLAVDSLLRPDAYPLVSSARSTRRLEQTGRKRGGRARSSASKPGRARRTARS